MLDDCFQKFLKYSRIEKGLSERTLESYDLTFRLFVGFLKMEAPSLDVLSKDFIRSFLYYGKDERKWGQKTYVINFHNLKVFIRFLIMEEHIETDPMATLEKPKAKKPIIQPLSPESVQKILYVALTKSASYQFVKLRNFSMFYLSLHSGLRLSEILNLRLYDVNFEESILHVRDGKGGKDRLVAITMELSQILKNYISERSKFFPLSPVLQLFCSARGKSFKVRDFHRVVETVKKLSGIDFSAHDFRRTYATTLSRKGVSPFIIQQQLGHSNIKTTMRYVVHDLQDCKDAVKNLVLY